MYKLNNKTNVYTQKHKEELLFNSYIKKVQKGGHGKDSHMYQYELANCYMNGKGVKKNHTEAIRYLKIAAYGGHMKAQYYLCNYYEEGKYIKKNMNKALYWCRKSVEQDFDLAQNKLGCYYEEGKHVDKNSVEAMHMFRKASEQNNGVAQNNLGLSYEYGKGTEINIAEAIKWYRRGSKEDNCRAHCNLGNCYKYNKGIEKHDINMKIAFKLYNKAIEQGCICEDTVYEYALCFEHGDGVDKDLSKAFTLYKKAAYLDYSKACFKVAEFYLYGKGIQINIEESKKWSDKAKNLGYCIHLIQDLEKKIERQDLVNPVNKIAFEKSRYKNNSKNDEKILETRAITYDVNDDCDDNDSICDECGGCNDCNDNDSICDECGGCNDYNDCDGNDGICDDCGGCDDCEAQELEKPVRKDENQNIVTNELVNLSKEEDKKDMDVYLNKEEFQKHMIKYKINIEDQKKMMKKFNFYKNGIEETLKLQRKNKHILAHLKLNIVDRNKDFNKELLELLNYYTKKLDIIIKYYLDNKIYKNNYDGEVLNRELNYIKMLYLRYNYNCGVLNHELENYEEAITYYEEAAYNKYPLAQKALSYCYKHGIYYEQSIEKSDMWYNLYLNNKEQDLKKTALQKSQVKSHVKKLEIENVD